MLSFLASSWSDGTKTVPSFWADGFPTDVNKYGEYELCGAQGKFMDTCTLTLGSQITGVTIVYPTDSSGANQRKHQSSTSLVFVRGIHRWPVNSPHKWPVTRKMFPFDDVIMPFSYWIYVRKLKHILGLCYFPTLRGHGLTTSVLVEVLLSYASNIVVGDHMGAQGPIHEELWFSWWRHQMEPFSALLTLARGILRSPVDSPHKGRWRGALNKWLSKQSRSRWFDTPSHPLWRHCNVWPGLSGTSCTPVY